MSDEIKVCYIVDIDDGNITMSDLTDEVVKETYGTSENFIVVDIKNNKHWNPYDEEWQTVPVKNVMEEQEAKEEADESDPDDDMDKKED